MRSIYHYNPIFLAGSFEERASEMPEEFKKAIFSISNEEGLPSQNYKCYQCDTPIGIIYGPAAVCCFTGKYYCSKCHINDVSRNNFYEFNFLFYHLRNR